MTRGDEPTYMGIVNDAKWNKVGDAPLWKNQSKKGFKHLAGIISKKDGSRLRIILFEAQENVDGQKRDETENDEDRFYTRPRLFFQHMTDSGEKMSGSNLSRCKPAFRDHFQARMIRLQSHVEKIPQCCTHQELRFGCSRA